MADDDGRDGERGKDLLYLAAQALAQQGVERGKGLVQQKERRTRAQGPCQRHTLLLPAGKVAGIQAGQMGDAQALQQIHGPGALLPGQAPGQQARPGIGHVMQHAQMREQGVILEHVADAPPPGRHTDALPTVIEDVPVHHDAPGIGPHQTGKAMQGQGLARTGGTEQDKGTAVFRHLQMDAQMEGGRPAGIIERFCDIQRDHALRRLLLYLTSTSAAMSSITHSPEVTSTSRVASASLPAWKAS